MNSCLLSPLDSHSDVAVPGESGRLRRSFLVLLSVIACSFSLTSRAVAENKTTTPLRGLLITGGCCHDYDHQKQIITEGMSQRANITWDVVHEGGSGRDHRISVYGDPDWAKAYDVIFHNECFGGVADDVFVESIAAAHHAGVPAVFVHCSLHSYRSAPAGADAWRELIGVTSQKHEKKRAVTVKKLNGDHPVMKGFPEAWKTPQGELYKIEKVWPNCIPLAQAFGEDTQKDHTVIWVNTFGRARVFGTSLGHHNETMNTDEWLDTVARGLLWTVEQLQADGTPMPGYEGTGRKRIVLDTQAPGPVPDARFSAPN